MLTITVENPRIVSQQEWPAAHKKSLLKKKQHAAEYDAIAGERRALLWVQGIVVTAILLVTSKALAQDGKAKYPSMAPLEQYLIADRDAEISLARSGPKIDLGQRRDPRFQSPRLRDRG